MPRLSHLCERSNNIAPHGVLPTVHGKKGQPLPIITIKILSTSDLHRNSSTPVVPRPRRLGEQVIGDSKNARDSGLVSTRAPLRRAWRQSADPSVRLNVVSTYSQWHAIGEGRAPYSRRPWYSSSRLCGTSHGTVLQCEGARCRVSSHCLDVFGGKSFTQAVERPGPSEHDGADGDRSDFFIEIKKSTPCVHVLCV